MGGMTPIATGLTSIAGTLGTLNTIVSTVQTLSGSSADSGDLALRQLQERQALEMKKAAADTAIAREKMALEAASSEEDRKRALKRAVARQKASFGGQGISSANGSAQAILLGLFDESEDEAQTRAKLDGLKSAALEQDLGNRASINVLQRTQLAQRQKLDKQITGLRDLF
ncbi:MAG: transporter [Micavibrio sp.]|nr:transporter [Micavibrio sp.]